VNRERHVNAGERDYAGPQVQRLLGHIHAARSADARHSVDPSL